jgi:hypothetical protein
VGGVTEKKKVISGTPGTPEVLVNKASESSSMKDTYIARIKA